MQDLTVDPTTPSRQRCMALTQARFRLFPIRSPLLWESLFIFFSFRYWDGSIPWVPAAEAMNSLRGNANTNCVRFAHSEICGSMYACYSPQLIAAGHVFHRSLAPRHPPCALNNLLLLNTRSFFDSIKLCATSFDIASYQKDLLINWMFFHRISFSNLLTSFWSSPPRW